MKNGVRMQNKEPTVRTEIAYKQRIEESRRRERM